MGSDGKAVWIKRQRDSRYIAFTFGRKKPRLFKGAASRQGGSHRQPARKTQTGKNDTGRMGLTMYFGCDAGPRVTRRMVAAHEV
jgi:hypothetical protein